MIYKCAITGTLELNAIENVVIVYKPITAITSTEVACTDVYTDTKGNIVTKVCTFFITRLIINTCTILIRHFETWNSLT